MKNLDEWLRNILGISHDLQTKLLASLIALFLLWLIRKIALKIADKRNPDVRVRYRWRKVSIYIAFAIGVFLIGRIWFEGFQSISTYQVCCPQALRSPCRTLLLAIVNKHTEHMSGAAETKLRRAAQNFMIFFTKLTPIVYTSVKDCGVLLTVRYLCEPRKRRADQQAIWEDILDAFSTCDDIDFAYPTQRFYNNMFEGKPEAKASPGKEPEGHAGHV